MAVRLLQPYAGQATYTIYQGPDEGTLKAVSAADDYIEQASDYPAYTRAQARAAIDRVGDSTARSNRTQGTFSVIGDSIQAGTGVGTVGQRASALSMGRHRYRTDANLAVGGTRTDQILATVPAAIATGYRRCLVNGGTNDFKQGTTLADTRANIRATFAQLRASGVEPVSIGMCPTLDSAALALSHANLEIWKQLYCAREGIAHAHVWPKLATATGGWLSGYNADNLHPSSTGITAMALVTKDVLDDPARLSPILALIDEANGTSAQGTFLRNAVTFGGVSASIPAGYFATGPNAGSVAGSVEAADAGDFGNWLTATITGAVSLSGIQGTALNPSANGWQVGDRIAIGVRIRATGTTPGSLKFRAFLGGSIGAMQNFAAFDEDAGTGIDGYYYTEAVLTSLANGAFYLVATTTGSGAQKLQMQRPIMFNMTQAGF